MGKKEYLNYMKVIFIYVAIFIFLLFGPVFITNILCYGILGTFDIFSETRIRIFKVLTCLLIYVPTGITCFYIAGKYSWKNENKE